MKKITLIAGLLFLTQNAQAQLDVFQDFALGVNNGWTATLNDGSGTSSGVGCEPNNMAYYCQMTSLIPGYDSGFIQSPELSVDDELVTIKFDYKLRNMLATSQVAVADWGSITIKYTLDGTNWIVLDTINSENHTPILECTTYEFTTEALTSQNLRFRWEMANVPAANIQITFDNIEITSTPFLSNATFEEKLFRVYPNPTSNVVSIDGDYSIQSIALYDVSGREVFATNTPLRTIDISDFANGQYILRITSDANKVSNYKIIKK